MQIYLDNASTTQMDTEVIKAMENAMHYEFGNPQTIHAAGRSAKTLIENARKTIAKYLNVYPTELMFTSGAADANRIAIDNNIFHFDRKHFISSPLEHLSIINPLKYYEKKGLIKLDFVKIDKKGKINLESLEELLQKHPNAFVSLMHANNEIGNLLPIKSVSQLCQKYDAIFHSDMAQSVGHYHVNVKATGVDLASISSHKFHGPKGIGILYINHSHIEKKPLVYGDFYERGIHGAKNLYGIVGLEKALEIFEHNVDENIQKVSELKKHMLIQLKKEFCNLSFLGESDEKGLYTILSVGFPKNKFPETLVMNLDIEGIASSQGVTASIEVNRQSHVLKALQIRPDIIPVRFSFSKYNTHEEIDYCIKVLKKYKM